MKEIAIRFLRLTAVVGIGLLIMRFIGPRIGEQMERRFEQAPDDFPPKWMFNNISAIRENTERILEAVTHGERGTEAA